MRKRWLRPRRWLVRPGDVSAGDRVEAGQFAGRIPFSSGSPNSGFAAYPVRLQTGIVLAHTNRGLVERGDLTRAMIATPYIEDENKVT